MCREAHSPLETLVLAVRELLAEPGALRTTLLGRDRYNCACAITLTLKSQWGEQEQRDKKGCLFIT